MSKIELAVCKKILDRAEHGLCKYGVSLERTDLTLDQWLCHAQEEAMDLACYLERLRALLLVQTTSSEAGLLVSSTNCDSNSNGT